MKRCNRIIVLLNDAELQALQHLEQSYNSVGIVATKSFLVRYGLKRLPLFPQSLPL